ncbi:MAG: zinc ribbon domain-containing protein, partial [Chloroflexi bacterium]|nr:zinc ribbon domain-containing protein [Chloroflexota bacterium]
MPTYEYECASCGHRFEKVQGFSEEPLKECPVCEGPVRKVFHPVGIIFKGTGWYVT